MQQRRWLFGKTGLVVAALGMVALALVGCSSTEASPKAPSAAAVAAELSQSQTKGAGDNAGDGASKGQVRTSQGGSVTIDVTWENPKQTTASLTFSVGMDTHSIDLDNIDLSKQAVLRNDRGQELKPERWDSPPGGHHRSGVLTFPAKDGSGRPIVDAGVKVVELVIRDVSGVKERVLRWEVS